MGDHTLSIHSKHTPTPDSEEPHVGTWSLRGPPQAEAQAGQWLPSHPEPLLYGPLSRAQVVPTLPTPLPLAHAAGPPGAQAGCGAGRPAGLPGVSAAAPA